MTYAALAEVRASPGAGPALWARWHALSAVLLSASTAGTTYAFGLFSEVLKKRLRFSQVQLSVVGSVGSTGLYTSVLCGLAMSYCGQPTAILCGGALLIFSGNMYLWVAVSGASVPQSVAAIAAANFIAQMGVACVSCTVTTVSIRLFPPSARGRAAGMGKAYFGVSSAVLASVSTAFFSGDPGLFLLCVALVVPVVQLYAAFNTNFLPPSLVTLQHDIDAGRPSSLGPYATHLATLIAVIVVTGAVNHWGEVGTVGSGILGAGLAALVVSVMAIPSWYGARTVAVGAAEQEDGLEMNEYGGGEQEVDLSQSSATPLAPTSAASSRTMGEDCPSFHGRHMPLSEVVWTGRVYALMTILACIAGSGLLVTNNIQAIARASRQQASPFFVSVVALANAAGRVLVGYLADHVAGSVSRLQTLAGIAILMAAAHGGLAIASPFLLYPCLLAVGLAFGAAFSNVSAITADLYGDRHIGANYGFVDLAPIPGSYLLGAGLIALFYDRRDSSEGDGCEGPACFDYVFCVSSLACLLAAGLALGLHSATHM